MLQPRLLRSGTSWLSNPTTKTTPNYASVFVALSNLTLLHQPQYQDQKRSASHAAQGRANKAAPGPGKRLGAKKGQSEPVVPGNIIFRQRGSLWYPGENCVMGRDHTISALAQGFVRYYRDPAKHPKRKYIGVVFDESEQLPYPPNAARRRRLGMEAITITEAEVETEPSPESPMLTESETVVAGYTTSARSPPERLRTSFQTRPSNAAIGRVRQVRVRKDNNRKFFGAKAEAFRHGRAHQNRRKRLARIKAGLAGSADRKGKKGS